MGVDGMHCAPGLIMPLKTAGLPEVALRHLPGGQACAHKKENAFDSSPLHTVHACEP